MSVILHRVLQYVKKHQPCALPRNPDLLPDELKEINWSQLSKCVFDAIENQLLDGMHLSNGFAYLRLTQKGESALNP